MTKNIKIIILASLSFIACDNLGDETGSSSTGYTTSDGNAPTAGNANFSKYVALGDSFAAGYSDGALFIEGQKGAYPNLLAQQFATVGGGEFNTPFMADNVGGFAGSTTYTPRLYFNGSGPASVAQPPLNQVATTNQSTILTGDFNNMGIPGAKCIHLDYAGYGSTLGNPYFARFAKTPLTTVVDQAVAQNPTFFSLWIGGNDVLGFATSGGTNNADITPTTQFDAAYNNLVNKLTANGAKGVVANLPYINSLPFFTTVPTNPIPGLPATSAAQLNQLFGAINQICTATGQPTRFATLVADDGNSATTEANPLLIKDEDLALDLGPYITGALTPTLGATTAAYLGSIYGKARHAVNTTSGRDFILLTSRTVIGTTQSGAPSPFNTIGVSYPMQDSTLLTVAEVAMIKTATDAYNATIQAAATSKGLAFVDTTVAMNQLTSASGYTANGFTLTSNYVTGGAFSLDGVHPSPRGYALIANLFTQAINAKYGSNFGNLNLGNYRILFPAVL